MRIHDFELLLTLGTVGFRPRYPTGPLRPAYGADPLARPCPIDEIFVIGEKNVSTAWLRAQNSLPLAAGVKVARPAPARFPPTFGTRPKPRLCRPKGLAIYSTWRSSSRALSASLSGASSAIEPRRLLASAMIKAPAASTRKGPSQRRYVSLPKLGFSSTNWP